MINKLLQQLTHASDCVANDEVIAYPTETVFGLGCDPFSEIAVRKLLKLKNRTWQKGLIIIAANAEQLSPFLSQQWLQWLKGKHPDRPTTYVIPCLSSVPSWLKGSHNTLAIRITSHKVTRKLCQLAGPLVSTSANKRGATPLLDPSAVASVFKHQLGFIVFEKKASEKNDSSQLLSNPVRSSQIIDAVSGTVLRS